MPYVLTFDAVGNRFLQLINNILEHGCFPKNWKTSTIIPLEKKSNTIKCEEYRPINMVPIYEKLLELVVNKQIVDYIESNNLLTKYQAGFRKQNSEIDSLQMRQNQALRAILRCNRYTNIKKMLEKTELLSIRQIVFLNAMVVVLDQTINFK